MELELYQIQKAIHEEKQGQRYTLDFDSIWRIFGFKTRRTAKQVLFGRYFKINCLEELVYSQDYDKKHIAWLGRTYIDYSEKFYTSVLSLKIALQKMAPKHEKAEKWLCLMNTTIDNFKGFTQDDEIEIKTAKQINEDNKVNQEIKSREKTKTTKADEIRAKLEMDKFNLKKERDRALRQYKQAEVRTKVLQSELLQYNEQLVQEFRFSLEDLFNASGIASPSYLINVLYNNFEEDRDYIKEKLGRNVHIFLTPQCYNCLILALRSYKGVDVSRLPNPECIVIRVNEYFREDDEEHGKNKRFPKAR